ncbi:hypothetical protein BG262_01395 [Floricoccus penangensis]|uniref:Membrane protein 6-pyruvoyl-tetrahydropterin synthase-related domain-containing protein n=1 Tax=Floricoccus penangensis TaxID=1859475 RepID=A0A9Q5JH29_9LACT|nr:6-pyruvoyl-tetrahydropterin synthase-related protein [Floricoccus penangensis]OFI47015.1 hypothetical protein BG262_01395 [Floricoccus penangensis]
MDTSSQSQIMKKNRDNTPIIYDNFWIRNGIFLFLSILFILPLLLTNSYFPQSDDGAHIPRMYEIAQGMKVGHFFPDVSAYTFRQDGNGIHFFYPNSFSFIYALFINLTGKIVTGLYFGHIILLFVTQIVAYYSAKIFTKNTLKSFVFAILWAFSLYNFGNFLNRGASPSSFAYAFFPLALLGIYELFLGDNKKWWLASIGFSLVLLNHLVTSFTLVIFGIVLFALSIYWKKFTKERLISSVLFAVSAFLLTCSFLIPFAIQMTNVDILGADKRNMQALAASIYRILNISLDNDLTNPSFGFNFGIVLCIAYIIFGILLFTSEQVKSNTKLKKYFFLSLGFIILVSNLFPWIWFQNTPLSVIQFPDRFMPFTEIFILIFVIEFLFQFEFRNIPQFRTLFLLLFTIGSFLTVLNYKADNLTIVEGTKEFRKVRSQLPNEFSDKNIKEMAKRSNFGGNDYISEKQMTYTVNDTKNVRPSTNVFEQGIISASTSGLDEKVAYIDGEKSQIMLYNQDYTFMVNNLPNGDHTVRLPMTWYKGFEATDNNGTKLELQKDDDGYVVVNTKGQPQIKVQYIKSAAEKMGICISILSWILTIATVGFMYFRNKTQLVKDDEV